MFQEQLQLSEEPNDVFLANKELWDAEEKLEVEKERLRLREKLLQKEVELFRQQVSANICRVGG